MSFRFDVRFLLVVGLALVATLVVSLMLFGGKGATTATASPGGLDRYGGHHCWTSCRSYGLRTGDYHCHRSTKACKRSNRRHARHGH